MSENFLAKHYNSVMIALPWLIAAASLKWMKWMAAARWSGLRLLFYVVPDLRRHCAVKTTNPRSSSSPLSGHSRLNDLTETSIVKFLIFELHMGSDSVADVQVARGVRRVFHGLF